MKEGMSMSFHGEFANYKLSPARRLTVLLAISVVAMLCVAFSGCKMSHAAIPQIITEVQVAQPIQRDVPIHNEWVASLDGYVNAEIHPQVSGYIIRQDYQEGSVVRKGQVLFEIDPRPFQATLDGAKAKLAEAEAALGKSTLDVERDSPLAAKKVIPQAQLDTEIKEKLGPKHPCNQRRRRSSA